MTDHRRAGNIKSGRNRQVAILEKRRRILIVCEGTKTEPNYFNSIIDFYKLNGSVISGETVAFAVEGTGRSTLNLVSYAEKRQMRGADKFDTIWCVFDKDDFANDDFDNAIAKCQSHNYLRVAWSNEAFELWYVLHFEYLNSSPARNEGKARRYYEEQLDVMFKQIGPDKYNKNDGNVFELLGSERLNKAIVNAKKLMSTYGYATPFHDRKPATNIFELVQTLLDYASDVKTSEPTVSLTK